MSTQTIKQHTREGRRSLGRTAGAFAVAAAAGITAVALILGTRSGDDSTTAAPAATPETAAEEVATSFLEAYGALDAEQAVNLLADDADVSEVVRSVGAEGVEGTADEFRALLSFLDATRYRQAVHSCEELESSAAGTTVRCGFDFHNIRSDELGFGPYSGNHFVLTVRAGEIVRASTTWEIEDFSRQVWMPFARWVSRLHPDDFAVMYTGEGSGARLSEESIRLWGQRSREYVKAEEARIAPWVDTQLDPAGISSE